MAILIDLAHARKARRLFQILLERHGIRHFLQGDAPAAFKIDPLKLNETVEMCARWASLRTGNEATDETVAWLRTDIRRALIQTLAESMVRAGY